MSDVKRETLELNALTFSRLPDRADITMKLPQKWTALRGKDRFDRLSDRLGNFIDLDFSSLKFIEMTQAVETHDLQGYM